jgi:hypothetical protein
MNRINVLPYLISQFLNSINFCIARIKWFGPTIHFLLIAIYSSWYRISNILQIKEISLEISFLTYLFYTFFFLSERGYSQFCSREKSEIYFILNYHDPKLLYWIASAIWLETTIGAASRSAATVSVLLNCFCIQI